MVYRSWINRVLCPRVSGHRVSVSDFRLCRKSIQNNNDNGNRNNKDSNNNSSNNSNSNNDSNHNHNNNDNNNNDISNNNNIANIGHHVLG